MYDSKSTETSLDPDLSRTNLFIHVADNIFVSTSLIFKPLAEVDSKALTCCVISGFEY